MFLWSINYLFFWNVLKAKVIKVYQVITICIQSYPVCSYWFVLIKNYYICCILYSVSCLVDYFENKLRFILIMSVYLNVCQRTRLLSFFVSLLALIISSPTRKSHFPDDKFPSRLALKIHNNILRNPPICTFL